MKTVKHAKINVFYEIPDDGKHCPVCGHHAKSQCKCKIGCKTCPQGHTWYRNKKGEIVEGRGHPGESCSGSKSSAKDEGSSEDHPPKDPLIGHRVRAAKARKAR